jgi:trk system potassium uptake protein TrkA
MRFVFVGAGALAVLTARTLLARGHQVVLVETNRQIIDDLAEELDWGLIHGDGSRPAILREVGPAETDVLFCLTSNDQTNILASLVARSLGFRRVVTKIEDDALEHICAELGLNESLVPMRHVGHYLADLAEGQEALELAEVFRDEARVTTFVATAEQRVADLALPNLARAICLYREGRFQFAETDTLLRPGDEVVVLAHRSVLHALRERFGPR